MNERFTTKVDPWIPPLVLIGPIVGIAVTLAVKQVWAAVIVCAVFALTTLICWPCDYTLLADRLVIRSGVVKWVILYKTITGVERTRNPLSSPAWSLDRLAISYEDKQIMISPAQMEEFLVELSYKTGLKRSSSGLEQASSS